eukprot:TRINITY_DN28154_c0_g1_i1.p1 TRINITY_DN28154_c0_g1~~TRINITY_DN28154_c0_g1_i1.p1  ORF type:complete len:267 (+),score=29.67 TRINITY_DN28154_c0_g1_i1:43-843(+)
MKVLIIGGSSGIGKGLAIKHSALGDEVIIAARTKRDLIETDVACKAAGGRGCKILLTDITNVQSCGEMAESLKNQKIDLVYLTVGMGGHQLNGSAWDGRPETANIYSKMMSVNFTGCVNAISSLLPLMNNSMSHLCVINSASGLVGLPGRAAYCASKAALNALCETLIADKTYTVTLTEVFIVSVSGTNLRAKGIISGGTSPMPHTGSSSELPVEKVVNQIYSAVNKKKRRVYLPSKLRLVPIVKHLPFINSDALLEKLVWKKARL